MIRYNGSETPPDYNLQNVIAPTALFVGGEDTLASVKDNIHLANALPNVFHHEVIPEFGHFSFSVSYHAPEQVYNKITWYINEFESLGIPQVYNF